MNKTEQFELNQWESTDRILMEDFNSDNEILDAALGTLKTASESQAATLAQHAAAMAKLGNCRLYTTSYVGSGTSGQAYPNSLTFPSQPKMVLIAGSGGGNLLLIYPPAGFSTIFSIGQQSMLTVYLTVSGNTVTWYVQGNSYQQMNNSGTTYHVLALLDAAQ